MNGNGKDISVPVFGRLPRGNYPFLALPRPGDKPFVVRRDKFVKAMGTVQGREIEWEIVREPQITLHDESVYEEGKGPFRKIIDQRPADIVGPEREKLIVRHRNGTGHGVFKFYNLLTPDFRIRTEIEQWKRQVMRDHGYCDCYDYRRSGNCKHLNSRERKQAEKGMSKIERMIAKLERERDGIKLHEPERPWVLDGRLCQVCEQTQRYCERTDYRPYGVEVHEYVPGIGKYRQYDRERWLSWYMEKPLRREVMRIVRAWRNSLDSKSTSKLYKLVNAALEGYGMKVKKWSGMSVGEKRRYQKPDDPKYAKDWRGYRHRTDGDFEVYLEKLWMACGLVERPEREGVKQDWGGPGRYQGWLERLHDRKRLDEEIKGLKGELE